jgi:hypothetical protein
MLHARVTFNFHDERVDDVLVNLIDLIVDKISHHRKDDSNQ